MTAATQADATSLLSGMYACTLAELRTHPTGRASLWHTVSRASRLRAGVVNGDAPTVNYPHGYRGTTTGTTTTGTGTDTTTTATGIATGITCIARSTLS